MLALLVVNQEGVSQTHTVSEGAWVLGRRPECDVVLTEVTVSGRHAQVKGCGDHVLVTDLGSTNGTWLNGNKIEHARVNPGDELRLGHQVLQLKVAQPSESNQKPTARTLSIQTGAKLVVLQGLRPGTEFELDKPVWTLGKLGGARLVFVMRLNGWSVTLLDGAMPLKINGQDAPAVSIRLHDKDHIVYQGLALQFLRT